MFAFIFSYRHVQTNHDLPKYPKHNPQYPNYYYLCRHKMNI